MLDPRKRDRHILPPPPHDLGGSPVELGSWASTVSQQTLRGSVEICLTERGDNQPQKRTEARQTILLLILLSFQAIKTGTSWPPPQDLGGSPVELGA